MKKSTIWMIAIAMGTSFLALLYLQMRYLEQVIHMRQEQFDTSVTRSLYQAARNLELRETQAALLQAVPTTAADSTEALGSRKGDAPKAAPHVMVEATAKQNNYLLVDLATTQQDPKEVEEVRQQFQHHRATFEEAVYSLLYKAAQQPLVNRIDYAALDSDLQAAFRSNGINMPFHFYIATSDGREVYRCRDYDEEGSEVTFQQTLFPNDPPAQTGVLYIHFPDTRDYILSSVRFMIPALVFTLVLLLIFVYTIYTIFRQKRLTEIKNDFINNMTHEFKTPISSVSLAAQMLGDPTITKSEAMTKHLCDVIGDETKRLRFQVEKVLQMSMFDKKAATFKRRETDAQALVTDVVNTFRLKVETSGVTIDTNLTAQRATVFIDEIHFTNVLFNLLDNAVKYKDSERPLKLCVSTRNEGGRLFITIADNGIGIRRDDLRKIFDKFYRVHTGNRHDVKGFGLGLAYVNNVVRALGGTIHAESEYGRGTSFIISLPLMA